MGLNLFLNSNRHSLRRTYLLIAGLVAVIIISATIFSSLFVIDVNNNNARTLRLHKTVSETLSHIRNDIWEADTTLNEILIEPNKDQSARLKKALGQALDQLERLKAMPGIDKTALLPLISELDNTTRDIQKAMHELLELRNDPAWIYPVLTIMNTEMLVSNRQFTSSIALILHERSSNENLSAEDLALLNKLNTMRDSWRRMILSFRTVLLRFAALNKVDRIEQEHDVTLIHQQISTWLTNIQSIDDPAVEDSLARMQQSLDEWYGHFERFKKLRKASIWRADIEFNRTRIRPLHNKAISVLDMLDTGIYKWSVKNSEAVEDAATKINIELFVLAALGLGFVFIVYILINRSILTPIAKISDALAKDNHGDDKFMVPQRASKEIFNLVSAYNRMREQIHQRQKALEYQALHDSLTGLPNRALLNDRLEHAINIANRDETGITFMLIDLDRFKEINDTLGHQVGDHLLSEIGTRLASCMRKSDTVARLGGDEFAIIVPDTTQEHIENFIDIISDTINDVVTVETQNLYIGASIGITKYPDDCKTAENIVRYADIAMYHAKKNNLTHAFFNSNMNRLTVDNLSLLGDFKKELSSPSGQLMLFYQPKIDLFDRKVTGVEALLRWKHPKQGFISPEFIIRMAEQSGLIGELTLWVLDQAVSDCATWHRGHLRLNVCVNLSAWSLQDPTLAQNIDRILSRHELPARALSLEITESAVMSDPVRARETLKELDDMKLRLVIDDYGTGFSSLAYLKLLPVTVLKIDKSFVIDMLSDNNDLIIVRSTIDLAHNLGMMVVAEGVEDEETMIRLRQLKCDSAQGFHIAHPLPEDQLMDWLSSYELKTAL